MLDKTTLLLGEGLAMPLSLGIISLRFVFTISVWWIQLWCPITWFRKKKMFVIHVLSRKCKWLWLKYDCNDPFGIGASWPKSRLFTPTSTSFKLISSRDNSCSAESEQILGGMVLVWVMLRVIVPPAHVMSSWTNVRLSNFFLWMTSPSTRTSNWNACAVTKSMRPTYLTPLSVYIKWHETFIEILHLTLHPPRNVSSIS